MTNKALAVPLIRQRNVYGCCTESHICICLPNLNIIQGNTSNEGTNGAEESIEVS